MKKRYSLSVTACVAISAAGADFSQSKWVSSGGFPGADDIVRASTVAPDGTLYIAGDFSAVGDVAAQGVAKWDGSSWSPLGEGLNGDVYSLAVDSSGTLYAAGTFNAGGSFYGNDVAKWDGTSWSALGTGFNNGTYIFDLEVDTSDQLYAGGNFTSAGGSNANYIAKWDGINWSPLGAGLNAMVIDMDFDPAGNLFVGGRFTSAGGVTAHYIAKWDGAQWATVGGGASSYVQRIAADGVNEIYIGGFFTSVGDVNQLYINDRWTLVGDLAANQVAYWNGASWGAIGAGVPDVPLSMYLDKATDQLYVGSGSADLALLRWDGSSWETEGWADVGKVNTLSMDSSGNLFAGGGFFEMNGESALNMAWFDGATWSPAAATVQQNSLKGYILAMAQASDGTLYAGGSFSGVNDSSIVNIAKWNGSRWVGLPPVPLGNTPIRTMAIDASDTLYVGASGTVSGVYRWDGNAWTLVDSYIESLITTMLFDDAGNLYIGGNFTTVGSVAAKYIAKWDGASWSPVGDGMNKSVSALIFDDTGNLYAGGSFTQAGGSNINYVAKWDGASWSSLGAWSQYEGVNGPVMDLQFDASGSLIVAGGFNRVNNSPAQPFAKWNGTTWSEIDSGLSDWGDIQNARALTSDHEGNVYAGAYYWLSAEFRYGYGIAKWNGSTWSLAAQELNDQIYDLVWDAQSSTLYTAGKFTTAHGLAASAMAYMLFGPRVVDFTAEQRPGTKLVDILYEPVSDETNSLAISLSIQDGASAVSISAASGDLGPSVSVDGMKSIVWDAGTDWNNTSSPLTLALTASDGVNSNTANRTASVDSRDYTVLVTSDHGTPIPSGGSTLFAWGSSITGMVQHTISNGGTNYTCMGWHGTGSVPSLGTTTNTGSIALTDLSSSIDWRWIVDADSDQMPDDWELRYYGSSTGAVATADTDEDGYNTWQEYILGSNPTNGGSSFLFTPSPSQPTNTAFSIDFTTVSGRLYTVECTDELGSGNWQALTNFIGDGSAVQLIDPANIPACFYQVRIDWAE